MSARFSSSPSASSRLRAVGRWAGTPFRRYVAVVRDPDGNVAAVIPAFNQVDPTAYEELAEIVDRVTPEPEEVEP